MPPFWDVDLGRNEGVARTPPAPLTGLMAVTRVRQRGRRRGRRLGRGGGGGRAAVPVPVLAPAPGGGAGLSPPRTPPPIRGRRGAPRKWRATGRGEQRARFEALVRDGGGTAGAGRRRRTRPCGVRGRGAAGACVGLGCRASAGIGAGAGADTTTPVQCLPFPRLRVPLSCRSSLRPGINIGTLAAASVGPARCAPRLSDPLRQSGRSVSVRSACMRHGAWRLPALRPRRALLDKMG